MPVINVTQKEYDAFLWFRGEAMDKVEGGANDEYVAEYDEQCKQHENFRTKYFKAKNRDLVNSMVKKALKDK